MLNTIRGKLFIYFFVFVVLFQMTAILIYVSSNRLMKQYDDSFQRFLLLNSISQKTEQLYDETKIYVLEPSEENADNYYEKRIHCSKQKSDLKNCMLWTI